MVSVLTWRPKINSEVASVCTDTFRFRLYDKAVLTNTLLFSAPQGFLISQYGVLFYQKTKFFTRFAPLHLLSTIMNNKVRKKFMSNLQDPPSPHLQCSVCGAVRLLLEHCKWGKGRISSEFRFVSHLLSMIVTMDIGKQQIYGIRAPHQNFKQ